MTPTTILSLNVLPPLILILPLLAPHTPNFQYKAKTAIKLAFFLSLLPMTPMVSENLLNLSITWNWLNIASTPLPISIQFDLYSTLFIPIALFVTWNIVEFSIWYMNSDPKISLFLKYLLTFLITMILLVSANNLLTLFISWECVGIMSYFLIGWHFSRNNAGTASLQAVLYNRIGDIGLMFATLWLISFYDSTDFNFTLPMSHPTILLLALIIAAASKSAQFGLHPWLASAMEGPTPVSALLHSSTMVVAGIFLLIRIHPAIKDNQIALTTCLCLGAISTVFAAICALTQNDVKKIIAYSTSSQLGLMMVAIGLNTPHLAFFHICTHAFFKAMLFLCSGSIIHNLADEQDIRKMGGLHKALPITSTCTTIGSLALMGTPYLAGFFSKDAIIEATSTSNINTWALILTIVATSFTAVYSLRMIFFIFLQNPRYNPLHTINEDNPMLVKPLKRLAFGSISAGLLIYQTTFPPSPIVMTMPTYMKMTAIIVSALGLIVALDLASITWTHPPIYKNVTKTMNTTFYPALLHRLLPNWFFNSSLRTTFHLINTLWLEKMGPTGITALQLYPITKIQETQKGLKTYLSIFSVSLLICLLILQLV